MGRGGDGGQRLHGGLYVSPPRTFFSSSRITKGKLGCVKLRLGATMRFLLMLGGTCFALGNTKSDIAGEFEFTAHHEVPWADRVHSQCRSPYTGELVGHRGDELTVGPQ
jgi:hypothetical protein